MLASTMHRQRQRYALPSREARKYIIGVYPFSINSKSALKWLIRGINYIEREAALGLLDNFVLILACTFATKTAWTLAELM